MVLPAPNTSSIKEAVFVVNELVPRPEEGNIHFLADRNNPPLWKGRAAACYRGWVCHIHKLT